MTTISRTAFLEATSISSLTIGSNVENIETFALAPLMGKADIKISPDNEYYEMFDTVLVKKDGTTMIMGSIGAEQGKNADVKLLNVRDAMKNKGYWLKGIKNVEIGYAMLELEADTVKTVVAFEKAIEIDDEQLVISGNLKFQAFETEDCVVISSVDNGGNGKTYFITKDDYIVVETPLKDSEDWYNCSVLTFHKEGERIFYERIPYKFYNIQALGGIFEKCVSRDELFKETGTIVMDGGKIDYVPKKEVSVSDAVDLEREFELWCETIRLDPLKVTIDEYLQKNSSIYSLAQ